MPYSRKIEKLCIPQKETIIQAVKGCHERRLLKTTGRQKPSTTEGEEGDDPLWQLKSPCPSCRIP